MICATCGKANADHLVFCEDCGARLAPRIAPPTPPIGVPMTPPAAMQQTLPAEGTRCARCGSMSTPGMRFCITCGSPLEKPPSPPAVVAPAPAPVPETRTCKRCQGTSDKNAQFCRFCGAALAEPSAPGARVDGVPNKPTLPSAGELAQKVVPRTLDSTIVTPPVIAPAPEKAHGKLVVVHKDGGLGDSFALAERTDIGRTEGDCLFAEDQYMATRHARVIRKNGTLTVRDLGTTNGVYVRLRKDASQALQDQDLILLGQQVLRFEIVKDAEGGFGPASEQDTLVFGTPAAPRYARLSQRTTEGVSCDVFHIRKPETVLGRESGDVVFPDDPFISRRHASLRMAGKTFELADLGSSNGTFVRIRGEVPLQHGDEIRVGQQLLRVDLEA